MQKIFFALTGIILVTGCSGAEQNQIREAISTESINITSAGSCYYKIDGVRKDDRTPISPSDVTQSILSSVDVSELFKTISIISGPEIYGRIYFLLEKPCAENFETLKDLVETLPNIVEEQQDLDVDFVNFRETTWHEADFRQPDIKTEYGVEKGYYDPKPGSCYYRVAFMETITGDPVDRSKMSDAANNLKNDVIKSAYMDRSMPGRLHVQSSEPCDERHSDLIKAVEALPNTYKTMHDTEIRIVQFAKSHAAEFNAGQN